MPEPRPLRPWLAVILSLIAFPAGHFYAGSLRRGLTLWLLGIGLTVSGIVLALYSTESPMACIPLIAVVIIPFAIAVDAHRTAKRNRHEVRASYQHWLAIVGLTILLLVINSLFTDVLRSQVSEAFAVPSPGMADTILAGERILTNKLHYRFHEVKRGDVVIYAGTDPATETLVHRILALGGDEIEGRDEAIFLNGMKLDEPYAKFDDQFPKDARLSDFGPLRVPKDHVFMIGDNRRLSLDNRLTGPVPVSQIVGIASLIYWPREQIYLDPYGSETVPGPFHWSRLGRKLK